MIDMSINKFRKEIDAIDDEILKLIEQRYRLVQKVGEIKKASSSGVFVSEREKAIIERLSKQASSSLPLEAISAIFREIISGARLVEHPITIAYLKTDLLSILAAYSKFGSCISLKPLPALRDLISEVKNNLNSYAVIPTSDVSDPELNILAEITIQDPSAPEKNFKFVILGKSL